MNSIMLVGVVLSLARKKVPFILSSLDAFLELRKKAMVAADVLEWGWCGPPPDSFPTKQKKGKHSPAKFILWWWAPPSHASDIGIQWIGVACNNILISKQLHFVLKISNHDGV